jgi:hypothetical protein
MLVPSERKDGALVGGPRTEEGKEVVRWNATRHGMPQGACRWRTRQ